MLVKYREELTRPIQETLDFMRRIEAQLNMLSNDPVRIFNSGTFFSLSSFLSISPTLLYIVTHLKMMMLWRFAYLCLMPSMEKETEEWNKIYVDVCREGIKCRFVLSL